MELLIVRHADAGDRDEFAETGQPDHLRPLSKKGREQMRRAAAGIVALVPEVELVLTSPFTRAVQTAEILVQAYKHPLPPEETDSLEPEQDPARFLAAFGDRKADVVMVVGHEPHLGALATWLMTDADESRVIMKKGGACLLEFDKRFAAGEGSLRWLMDAKMLRAMAED